MNLDRFLHSDRGSDGTWFLEYDLYLWAKGIEPYPHLAAVTFPA
jgi:hypothetical protein